jgi:hypothetical protein
MNGKWLLFVVVLSLCACEAPRPTCEQRLAAIDVSAIEEREFNGPVGESAEGARILHGYRDDNRLVKVSAIFYGGRGRREIVYLLASLDTYSMTVNDVAYRQAISPDQPTEDDEVTSYRFTVCEGTIVSRPDEDPEQLSRFVDRLPEFASHEP